MTKIEWAEESWNPVTGCTKISEGCQHCYAERMAKRLKGRYGYPDDDPFRVTFHPDKLDQPLKWKKPKMIFVCSMGDLFHPGLLWSDNQKVWEIMAQCKNHTFMVLTKRPQRMKIYLTEDLNYKLSLPLSNVWLGVTAENQDRYDERWEIAKGIPAAKLIISMEPLLGPIEMRPWGRKPDGVFAGCESGPGRRSAKIQWFRDLKNQCVEAGIPFFLKQMATEPPPVPGLVTGIPLWYERFESKIVKMPELDGEIWDQRPE